MVGSIIGALSDLFSHDITVEPFVSSDIKGVPTYGVGVSRKGRVKGQNRMVRDAAGRERVSTVNVVFAGVFEVSVRDRYTLPAQFVPQQPVAISVSKAPDENGDHHERVFF